MTTVHNDANHLIPVGIIFLPFLYTKKERKQIFFVIKRLQTGFKCWLTFNKQPTNQKNSITTNIYFSLQSLWSHILFNLI